MDIRERIGKRIAYLRQENGLSQRQLAELSGVGNTHIARIEMGKYNIRVDVLKKLADALGVEIKIE